MFPDLFPDDHEVRYHPRTGRPITARYSANRRCDDRCVYARGDDCECQCGGRNHGAGWAEMMDQLRVTR